LQVVFKISCKVDQAPTNRRMDGQPQYIVAFSGECVIDNENARAVPRSRGGGRRRPTC